MDMDVYCREEAEMWKKADWKEWLETTQEQIEEEQREEFNTTMKTFNVAQKEVDKFKASLFASGAVTAWVSRSESSAICDHADKFLQVLLMFYNKPGSARWNHILDQLRRWGTLPAKIVTEIAASVKNGEEWRSFERQNKIRKEDEQAIKLKEIIARKN